MKFITLFIFLGLLSCEQHRFNLEAKQLTDSAFIIFKNTHDPLKALSLLDQATKIDSNYFPALSARLSFEMESKLLNKALLTAKSLIGIKPEVAEYYTTLGFIYEQRHDTVASKKYFTYAIVCYDKKLVTMSKANKKYDGILFNKSINLLLLGQRKYGNDILRELYDKSQDKEYKEMIELYMHKSKPEILEDMW